MANPETHTCDCGYEWVHGLSGSHSCSPHYQKRIADLEAKLQAATSQARDSALEEIEDALWKSGLDERAKAVSIVRALKTSPAPEQRQEPICILPYGLTIFGYSDPDEYYGDTLDEYAKQSKRVIGDEFQVTEGWSRERRFKIVGGGPTAQDPKATFIFKALDGCTSPAQEASKPICDQGCESRAYCKADPMCPPATGAQEAPQASELPPLRELDVIEVARMLIGLGFQSGHMVSQEAADDLLEQFNSKIEAEAEPQGALKEAPPNSLPSWNECQLRVENSDFIAKRMAEGGHGPDADSMLATELHRFIYEYDDADPYKSAWFLHRLEKVIEEARTAIASAGAGVPESDNVRGQVWIGTQKGCPMMKAHSADEAQNLRAMGYSVSGPATTSSDTSDVVKDASERQEFEKWFLEKYPQARSGHSAIAPFAKNLEADSWVAWQARAAIFRIRENGGNE